MSAAETSVALSRVTPSSLSTPFTGDSTRTTASGLPSAWEKLKSAPEKSVGLVFAGAEGDVGSGRQRGDVQHEAGRGRQAGAFGAVVGGDLDTDRAHVAGAGRAAEGAGGFVEQQPGRQRRTVGQGGLEVQGAAVAVVELAGNRERGERNALGGEVLN